MAGQLPVSAEPWGAGGARGLLVPQQAVTPEPLKAAYGLSPHWTRTQGDGQLRWDVQGYGGKSSWSASCVKSGRSETLHRKSTYFSFLL